MPSFDAASVARLIRRKRPTFLVGVPTLYAALSRDAGLAGADLSFLRAAFCGADSLPRPATEGEICIAGLAVMVGYLDDPEATRQALRRGADGRIWLHTGDLGRQEADGFFYFSVRLKRMIKSSSFNVYPAQVEAVLMQHPLVAEVCVISVPDPDQVERVVAWAVAKGAAGSARRREQELLDHCWAQMIKWS